MSKISIIVPVYNVEKFIDKCIESIVRQTYTDLEIILVNDGSTDKSGEICDIWAEKDNRIKVIHKSNNGVSAARNTGIAASSSEYIAFVDSDDTIAPNYAELLLKNIDGHDMAAGSIQKDIVSENRSVNYSVFTKSCTLQYIKTNIRKTINPQYISSPVNKLFKKSIINRNNLTFDTSMHIAEDYVFGLQYLSKCSKVKYFSDIIYYYNVHTSYVRSQSYIESRFKNRVKMCYALKDFYQSDTLYYYKRILSEFMYAAYYETIDNKSISDTNAFIREYISEHNLTELISKAKINFLDKKIFFKLMCRLLEQSGII